MNLAHDPQSDRRPWVLALGLLVFLLFFLKNAWVDEDAYITFRSIEQLYAGHGPIWNPHERVQAFTHPLWFALLAFVHLAIGDLYLASLVTALALGLGLVVLVWRAVPDPRRFGLAGLLLISSKSFFDFTSSGLEGPLTYLLLGAGFFLFMGIVEPPCAGPDPRASDDVRARRVAALALVTGLLLVTRHDSVWLGAPLLCGALVHERGLGARRLSGCVGAGALVPLIWTGFSLFYYGFALPNTAYAKLATGLPSGVLAVQGLRYVQSLCVDDPLGALLLVAALGLGVASLRRPGERGPAIVALGIALHALYVVRIGGDYMTGRFFGAAVLLAVLLVVRSTWLDARGLRGALIALAIASWLLPGSPVRSGADYASGPPNAFGVGDQRGIFFGTTSLGRWLRRDPDRPFPEHRWSEAGRALAGSDERVVVRANIGFLGYFAGTDKIIIDRLGLSDPLLARLPSLAIWRIGHFPRRVPVGYPESVRDGDDQIEDEAVAAFYARLRRVTQGPLLAPGRLAEIVRLNFAALPIRAAPAARHDP